MFSTSSAFATANAALAKQPVHITRIAGYKRAFSMPLYTGSGGFVPSLQFNPITQHGQLINDFGGTETFNSYVNLTQPITKGDLIFAFMYSNAGGSAPTLVDSAGNSWTKIFDTLAGGNGIGVWYTVAAADLAVTPLVGWGGTVDASDIVEFGVSGGGGFSEYYAVVVPGSYAATFAYGSSSGSGTTASVTIGSDTISVDLVTGTSWDLFGIVLAPGTSTATPVTLGIISTGTTPEPGYAAFSPQGSAALIVLPGVAVPLYDWLVSLADLKETISDLAGGSDLSDCVFNVQDQAQAITADLASFVFEGKLMQLLSGFQGLTFPTFATLFTGVVNTVESDNGNAEYQFDNSPKNLTKLTQKIFTIGNDGIHTIDSSNPLSLNGHPLDLFVTALEECGVDLSDIDTAKIFFYRDTIFSGLEMTFTLTSAPTGKDFIENELMKPLGMYYRENNLATVTVNSFYPALSGNGSYTPPSLPVTTLDIDLTTDVPLPGEADLVNQVIFKFDDDGSGNQNFLAENISDYDVSIARYGLFGAQTIESQGLRSAFQGYLIAIIVSVLIFLRYGLKNLLIDSLPCLWSEVTLEPGDIIALTEPYVPDRKAGVMGITSNTFEILDRNWKLMDGIVELKLLAIDLSKFKQYLITPNAEPVFASDTPTNQAKYMYQSDATGKYSTGAAGNTLG